MSASYTGRGRPSKAAKAASLRQGDALQGGGNQTGWPTALPTPPASATPSPPTRHQNSQVMSANRPSSQGQHMQPSHPQLQGGKRSNARPVSGVPAFTQPGNNPVIGTSGLPTQPRRILQPVSRFRHGGNPRTHLASVPAPSGPTIDTNDPWAQPEDESCERPAKRQCLGHECPRSNCEYCGKEKDKFDPFCPSCYMIDWEIPGLLRSWTRMTGMAGEGVTV